MTSYTIQLVSWDEKRTYTIYGPGQGDRGVYLLSDPQGLYDAPLKTWWENTTNNVGAIPTGASYPPRDVQISLGVVGEDSAERWRKLDSQLRLAFHEAHDTTLRVMTEYGTRELKVRLFDTPVMKSAYDPGVGRYAATIYSLRAGNPLWQGETHLIEWVFDGRNFYDTITVENPSDHPLYPQWVLPGPTSMLLPDFDLESGKEHWVTMPWQGKGMNVLVDTRPGVEEAVCAGRPLWLATVPEHFNNPIPPHTPPTKLPVVMNPFPFADATMKALGLPTRLPQKFIVETAKALAGDLSVQAPEAVQAMDTDNLAQKIHDALVQATQVVEDVAEDIAATITAALIGDLLKATYSAIPALAPQNIQLRLTPEYSRPYGVSIEDRG